MHSLLLVALMARAAAGPEAEGLRLLQAGRLAEAEAALDRAAAAAPGHVPTLQALAQVYTQERRLPDAIRACQRILALSPRDVEARARLAQLSAWSGDFDRAAVLYREAIALAPKALELKSDLGDVLRWARRWGEATRLYEEVLALSPGHHEAMKGLAKVHLLTGDAAGAIRVLDGALVIHPGDVDLHRDRARAFVLLGDLAHASAALERATLLAPSDADAYRQLGEVLLRQQDFARAADAYRKASALEPGQPENHVMLAKSYLAMDKLPLAREQVEVALLHSPLDPAANELATQLRAEAGVAPARTAGELAELAVYALVLAAVLLVARRMRRVLRRTPAYYYFTLWVLPAFILLNLAMHFVKPWLARWLDPALFEAATEAVLFLGLGVAFVVATRSQQTSPEMGGEVVLAIGAHPDDIELGTGGFLAKLRASGARVYGLTMTRGEKGTDARASRDAESARAAAWLGMEGSWVLDFPDTGLGDRVPALRAAIEEKIAAVGATMVLTHTDVDVHGDHRAVHAATREAARKVPTLLCYEDVSTAREFSPNYYVDISGYIDDHLKLVAFHRTQGHRTYMDPEVIKGRAAHRGMQAGVPYAQAFKALQLVR